MKKRLASVVVFFALLLAGANVWATVFTGLNSFGDSLSDSGSSPSAVMSICKLLDAPSADPASYVFWDVFHPTTAADAIIATAFAASVPEPGTIALLAVGLVALFYAGSRRRTPGR